MQISQKCRYGLRAVLELARRGQGVAVKVGEIAGAQAIPPRFLEIILNQLKKGGFVESRRGQAGGYALARSPRDLTLLEVIEFIEGPIRPVACVSASAEERCVLYGGCVFVEVWDEARSAMSEIFQRTTFQDLLERQRRKVAAALSYCI
ncbi:MAG: Rrf2 family transcriptional regulator [Planctomycetes bacterium]|nr:Rrf2 family transcriptional regulator [Planctomycetota bacterium]